MKLLSLLAKPLSALFIVLGLSSASASAGEAAKPTREAIALELIAAGALLVDVRTPEEFAAGHLEGALNIPHDQTEARLAEYGTDKSASIVVYCRSGRRSGIAEDILTKNGFTAVHNGGGYEALMAAVD